MNIDFVKFTTLNEIIDFVLALVLLVVIIFASIRFKFHKAAIIILLILSALAILFWFFKFDLVFLFLYIIATATVFVICFTHSAKIRSKFVSLSNVSHVETKKQPAKIIDHEKMYSEIYKAVEICSKQKIGALITFERRDDFKNIIKNGTIINAPITHELLVTIFYPGTRLHDGAVIIKDGMIYAASVYFTPTTRALTGKYGSRHRAALGISEITDSVTVVVSEETGRISIAQNGELDPVHLDNFIQELDSHFHVSN